MKIMEKTPCEDFVWNLFPIIRKELTCCLIKDFGLSQKETAEKMGMTPAAVSQYICHKRGKKHIKDETIRKEIMVSAGKIVDKGETIVGAEVCRLYKIINSKGLYWDIF